jgi:hypothetical protein
MRTESKLRRKCKNGHVNAIKSLLILSLIIGVSIGLFSQEGCTIKNSDKKQYLPVAELYFDDILATVDDNLSNGGKMPGEIDQVMFSDNGEILVDLVQQVNNSDYYHNKTIDV